MPAWSKKAHSNCRVPRPAFEEMDHDSGLVERTGENIPSRGNHLFKGESQLKSCQVYNENEKNGLTGKEGTRLEKERSPGRDEECGGQGCSGCAC